MDAAERAFYRRWIWANGWAELLGLGGSMALGWFGTQALASVGDSPAVVVGSMVVAIVLGTCLEGTLVGYAQARIRVIGTVGLTCLGTGVVVGAVHGPVMIVLLRRQPAP